MAYIPPKKRFGQHYLIDGDVLQSIIELLSDNIKNENIMEIGPGMGALTKYLWKDYRDRLQLVELDRRCVAYLKKEYKGIDKKLIQADFLKLDIAELIQQPTAIIGNFPYNISSQIIFKIIENHEHIPLVIGMFQKEVAVRLAGKPGSKAFAGISIFAQLNYDIEVAFHIPPEKFDPPPKVVSSVIIMKKKENPYTGFDHKAFKTVVKTAFSLRRKKLKNAMAGILEGRTLPDAYIDKRAEALSIEDFIALTNWWQNGKTAT